MKRGPYRNGGGGKLRRLPNNTAAKQMGPPNLYPARAECRCNRSLPDEDEICVLCGHNVSNASNGKRER